MSFLQNLNWRYATKKFSDRKLDDATLDQVLEAIRLAPTSYGLQPFHVTVVTQPELKQSIQGASFNQPQVTTCSHLLVFSARTDLNDRLNSYLNLAAEHTPGGRQTLSGLEKMIRMFFATLWWPGRRKNWAAKQAYIALGFAMAAAAELQVDSCPMEGFMPPMVKAKLGLPSHLSPVVMLPIGYRADDDQPRAKTRFPATEMFDRR